MLSRTLSVLPIYTKVGSFVSGVSEVCFFYSFGFFNASDQNRNIDCKDTKLIPAWELQVYRCASECTNSVRTIHKKTLNDLNYHGKLNYVMHNIHHFSDARKTQDI